MYTEAKGLNIDVITENTASYVLNQNGCIFQNIGTNEVRLTVSVNKYFTIKSGSTLSIQPEEFERIEQKLDISFEGTGTNRLEILKSV